jgi:hexosaminidase
MRVLRALLASICVIAIAGSGTARADAPGDGYPAAAVVPRPRYERFEPGRFAWPVRARIAVRHPSDRVAAEHLRGYLAANGVPATVGDIGEHQADTGRARNANRAKGTHAAGIRRAPLTHAYDVVLERPARFDARLGDEGYALRASRTGITLRANGARGLFYAVQTLQQMSGQSQHRLFTRAGTVVDRPAYRWRGIHLDTARHFFAVPVIERYIDVAAHYKLNVFHWHLTDDQAWRLRSDRYPALASGSAYSRADVDRVVAYAAHLYVTVVPEIDMPGHADAVLRAYPQLRCAHDTLCTTGAGLAFARDVLGEAMAAFPSPYVHAGGDEVPPPASAVQPRFTRALEAHVRSRGRRLVGWDEIFTPQLSRDAIVMVWTSPKRAVAAARHGNDVVRASGALYFDAAQGEPAQEPRASRHMATLQQVYDYTVMPAGLTRAEAAHVIGGQANVWTEHIASADHLFYMTLPRELALAEILWTPRERKSWDSFLARLPTQFRWLENHGYPFRIPNVAFDVSGGPASFEAVPGHVQSVTARTAARSVTVALTVPLSDAVIRYTADGSAPSAASKAYGGPFVVPVTRAPVRIRAAAFLHGRRGAVTECTVVRSSVTALRARRGASASWKALVSP